MLSPLRRAKLTRAFRLFDADDDGRLTFADLGKLATRLGAVRGWGANHEDTLNLVRAYAEMFDAVIRHLAVNPVSGVTLDQWLVGLEALMARRADIHVRIADLVFSLLDERGLGRIDLQRYKDFVTAHRVPGAAEGAAAWFARLDLNRDGTITRDENRANLRDFFYSDDADAPGNSLFGAIDDQS